MLSLISVPNENINRDLFRFSMRANDLLSALRKFLDF